MSAVINVREHSRLNFNRLPAIVKQQIDVAQLTPLYQQAKRDLIELSRVDEVKEIADRHSAIAHYAKQIKDNTLLHYAERIYARALARIGELLEELEPKERALVSKQNGLSVVESDHARNIGALPKRARDALIDRDPPTSKIEMSRLGYEIRAKPGRRASNFRQYVDHQEPAGRLRTAIEDVISHFVEDEYHRDRALTLGGWIATPELVDQISPDEAGHLRKLLTPLMEFLDDLDHRLALKAGR